MIENDVEVKTNNETFAVMIRLLPHKDVVSHEYVDTRLFGDVSSAKLYCRLRWRIQEEDWEDYLMTCTNGESMNPARSVFRCRGWRCDNGRFGMFYIHEERKVVEF